MSLKRRKHDDSGVSECLDQNCRARGHTKRPRNQSFASTELQALLHLNANQVAEADATNEDAELSDKPAAISQPQPQQFGAHQIQPDLPKDAQVLSGVDPGNPYLDINTLLKELHYQRIMRHGLETLHHTV